MRKAISFFIGLAVLGLAAGSAYAQPPKVTVLGLASEQHADLAEKITAALRSAVERVSGMEHTKRDVTLPQMLLAFQCPDQPTPECLASIGGGLKSDFIILGGIAPVAGADQVLLNLQLFDVLSKEVTGNIEEEPWPLNLGGPEADAVADALVLRLKKSAGDVKVRSKDEGSEILIDEKSVGRIAGGVLLVRSIALGAHTVSLVAADNRQGKQEITVTPEKINDVELKAEEAPLPAAAAPAPVEEQKPLPAATAPEERSQTWTIVGASLVGGGLGLAGLGLGFGLYVKVLDNDAKIIDYRSQVPAGHGVCSYAKNQHSAAASDVTDLCNKSSTFEIMEWVFIGTGLAAFAGGVVILALDLDHPKKGEASQARLSVSPLVAGATNGFAARIDF